MRVTARRPVRRRVHGGQISSPIDQGSGSIVANCAEPMGRIRLRSQRINRGSSAGSSASLREVADRAMPTASASSATESGDRCSLSKSCGHRGRRRSGGEPRGALRTVYASRLQTRARSRTVRALVGFPAGGTIVPKLGSRSSTQRSRRPTRSAGLGSALTRTQPRHHLAVMSRNSSVAVAAGKMSLEWTGIRMHRFRNRRYDIPHHPLAHDVMMGVTDAQGLIAIVDARVNGERPRPEIQPVGKCQGRQRQVRAVQHGETLTSAADEAGSRCETTASPGGVPGCCVTGVRGDFDAPRSIYRVMGVRWSSRDLDVTGQHTRSSLTQSEKPGIPGSRFPVRRVLRPAPECAT